MFYHYAYIGQFWQEINVRVGGMSQWMKNPAIKFDTLSLVLGTHMIEGENLLLHIVSINTFASHFYVCSHINKMKNTYKTDGFEVSCHNI